MTEAANLRDMLGRVELFAGLEPKELDRILRAAHEVEHQSGDVVVREGDRGAGFHLILDGSVSVTQGGNQLRTLSPGEYFGDMALVDGRPRSATVTATSALRTLSLSSWEFKSLLLEDPQITFHVLQQTVGRLRDAEAR